MGSSCSSGNSLKSGKHAVVFRMLDQYSAFEWSRIRRRSELREELAKGRFVSEKDKMLMEALEADIKEERLLQIEYHRAFLEYLNDRRELELSYKAERLRLRLEAGLPEEPADAPLLSEHAFPNKVQNYQKMIEQHPVLPLLKDSK